jgi:hypothetical protein
MKSQIGILATSLIALSTLHAKEPAATYTPAAPEASGWSFRAAPYAWLTAIDGDIAVGPLSAPVDISFGDTLDKLDMAYMGLVELGYDRWTLGADIVYGKFSNDIEGGGRIFRSFRYEYSQLVITPTLGYRVLESDTYHLDVFVGARMNWLDTTLTGRFVGGGQTQRSADESWADPIVGIRGQAALGDDFFMRYNADIGGFGVSSDLVWQAFLGLGYNITDSASVAIGYRGLGVDYSDGPLAFDTVTHGPVLGFELRF